MGPPRDSWCPCRTTFPTQKTESAPLWQVGFVAAGVALEFRPGIPCSWTGNTGRGRDLQQDTAPPARVYFRNSQRFMLTPWYTHMQCPGGDGRPEQLPLSRSVPLGYQWWGVLIAPDQADIEGIIRQAGEFIPRGDIVVPERGTDAHIIAHLVIQADFRPQAEGPSG